MTVAAITSCGGDQRCRVLWTGETQNRENNPMQSRTAQEKGPASRPNLISSDPPQREEAAECLAAGTEAWASR